MRNKFVAIERELNAVFLEREEVVRGLLVGLLARQHVLLLGPPGTAKSALVENLCDRIGGTYFRWLLSRTSTPEELFGPISLRALERDKYERVTTGKLPEAHIAFLDEIFKSNSAVLNSMLSVLNERLFFNNGNPVQVPLEFAVGASNELPEDREELGALWDRFLLRYQVKYIREERSFLAMLMGTTSNNQYTTISLAELKRAQEDVAKVDVSSVAKHIIDLRQRLSQEQIVPSDRRWKATLGLIKANAWLEGRSKATEDDLAILTAALWDSPDQIPQVRTIIMTLANPFEHETQNLLDQADELYREAMAFDADGEASALAAKGVEVHAKMRRIVQLLEGLITQSEAKGKDPRRIEETLERVKEMNHEVVKRCLGIE